LLFLLRDEEESELDDPEELDFFLVPDELLELFEWLLLPL
jgi:hypothetical protein